MCAWLKVDFFVVKEPFQAKLRVFLLEFARCGYRLRLKKKLNIQYPKTKSHLLYKQVERLKQESVMFEDMIFLLGIWGSRRKGNFLSHLCAHCVFFWYIKAILCSGLTTCFNDVLLIHAGIAFLSFRSRTMKDTLQSALQLKTVSWVRNFASMVS